jgi:hypothetical protein
MSYAPGPMARSNSVEPLGLKNYGVQGKDNPTDLYRLCSYVPGPGLTLA